MTDNKDNLPNELRDIAKELLSVGVEGFDHSLHQAADALEAKQWQPIESHALDDKKCMLGVFQNEQLYVADMGGWVAGETYEEWDEVEDGIAIKLYEEEDEGHWWSNHGIIEEPTHWQPLPTPPTETKDR